eukprot:106026_1
MAEQSKNNHQSRDYRTLLKELQTHEDSKNEFYESHHERYNWNTKQSMKDGINLYTNRVQNLTGNQIQSLDLDDYSVKVALEYAAADCDRDSKHRTQHFKSLFQHKRSDSGRHKVKPVFCVSQPQVTQTNEAKQQQGFDMRFIKHQRAKPSINSNTNTPPIEPKPSARSNTNKTNSKSKLILKNENADELFEGHGDKHGDKQGRGGGGNGQGAGVNRTDQKEEHTNVNEHRETATQTEPVLPDYDTNGIRIFVMETASTSYVVKLRVIETTSYISLDALIRMCGEFGEVKSMQCQYCVNTEINIEFFSYDSMCRCRDYFTT